MVTIEVKGLKELQGKLKTLPQRLKTEVSAVVESGVKTFVRNAKRDVPRQFGFLGNGISYTFLISDKTRTSFMVVSNFKYSPYIEWGTITRVRVPSELQAYAIQFKGKGIRKNGGIYPHPFFFKQTPITKAQIEKGIGQIIKDEKL
jgi:hypothetical protein